MNMKTKTITHRNGSAITELLYKLLTWHDDPSKSIHACEIQESFCRVGDYSQRQWVVFSLSDEDVKLLNNLPWCRHAITKSAWIANHDYYPFE